MIRDWATIGGTYSNFAGILAGFAFSGIFLLVEAKKKEAADAITILLISFTGLALASYLYANISGVIVDTSNRENLIIMSLRMAITGMIFSVAIIQMYLSLVFIFIIYHLPNQLINFGKTIYYGSSIMVTIFVIRIIPDLQQDINIHLALTRDLVKTLAFSLILIFVLSKLFEKNLDKILDKYFIQIVNSTFLFLLVLVVIYNADFLFHGTIPVFVDHLIVVMFAIDSMTNHLCLNYRYRKMMKIGEQEILMPKGL